MFEISQFCVWDVNVHLAGRCFACSSRGTMKRIRRTGQARLSKFQESSTPTQRHHRPYLFHHLSSSCLPTHFPPHSSVNQDASFSQFAPACGGLGLTIELERSPCVHRPSSRASFLNDTSLALVEEQASCVAAQGNAWSCLGYRWRARI